MCCEDLCPCINTSVSSIYRTYAYMQSMCQYTFTLHFKTRHTRLFSRDDLSRCCTRLHHQQIMSEKQLMQRCVTSAVEAISLVFSKLSPALSLNLLRSIPSIHATSSHPELFYSSICHAATPGWGNGHYAGACEPSLSGVWDKTELTSGFSHIAVSYETASE